MNYLVAIINIDINANQMVPRHQLTLQGKKKTAKGKTSIHTFQKNKLIIFSKEKEQKNKCIWVHLKSHNICIFQK